MPGNEVYIPHANIEERRSKKMKEYKIGKETFGLFRGEPTIWSDPTLRRTAKGFPKKLTNFKPRSQLSVAHIQLKTKACRRVNQR